MSLSTLLLSNNLIHKTMDTSEFSPAKFIVQTKRHPSDDNNVAAHFSRCRDQVLKEIQEIISAREKTNSVVPELHNSTNLNDFCCDLFCYLRFCCFIELTYATNRCLIEPLVNDVTNVAISQSRVSGVSTCMRVL